MEIKFNLFRNDKKGNDKAPDYRGNDMDKTHEVACWVKPTKGGKGQYLSCVLKPSTGTKPTGNGVPPSRNSDELSALNGEPNPNETEDDLPF